MNENFDVGNQSGKFKIYFLILTARGKEMAILNFLYKFLENPKYRTMC